MTIVNEKGVTKNSIFMWLDAGGCPTGSEKIDNLDGRYIQLTSTASEVNDTADVTTKEHTHTALTTCAGGGTGCTVRGSGSFPVETPTFGIPAIKILLCIASDI